MDGVGFYKDPKGKKVFDMSVEMTIAAADRRANNNLYSQVCSADHAFTNKINLIYLQVKEKG